MGDSLTDKKHGANAKLAWPELLHESLKGQGVNATIINPAIGGTTLAQNTVLIPRWVKEAPSPDLVVINFGFNDVQSGKVTGERYKDHLLLAIDRIRRETKGSADILVVTTCPGLKFWESFKELEDAARAAAKEKQTGFADLAAEVRKLGTPEEVQKLPFWSADNVHLAQKGKETFCSVVLKAITSGQ
jgi:lysophospholipase L1-like esterase